MKKEYGNSKKIQKRIDKFAEKYAGKKIVLYGAGALLEDIYKELDFSKLNIIAVSDIKFLPDNEQNFFGIKCISPSDIKPSDFDVILTTVLKPCAVIPFLNKIIKGNSIKIEHLIEETKKEKKPCCIFSKLFKHNKNAVSDNSNIEILEHLSNLEKKLSMPDNIWQTKNAKFYVPYYPIDIIQRIIVNNNSFFEYDILIRLDNYLKDDAVILDIGANIGNHSLYWAKASSKKIKKIYAFEPVQDTFNILKKNVEINNLENTIELYNIGLSDKSSKATYMTYNRANIGDTHLVENETGDMELKRLDDIDFPESKIDFVKIDVESMEIPLLKGAKQTLLKYKPSFIFIESEYQINEVTSLLAECGYEKYEDYPCQNWLFKLKEQEK